MAWRLPHLDGLAKAVNIAAVVTNHLRGHRAERLCGIASSVTNHRDQRPPISSKWEAKIRVAPAHRQRLAGGSTQLKMDADGRYLETARRRAGLGLGLCPATQRSMSTCTHCIRTLSRRGTASVCLVVSEVTGLHGYCLLPTLGWHSRGNGSALAGRLLVAPRRGHASQRSHHPITTPLTEGRPVLDTETQPSRSWAWQRVHTHTHTRTHAHTHTHTHLRLGSRLLHLHLESSLACTPAGNGNALGSIPATDRDGPGGGAAGSVGAPGPMRAPLPFRSR
jgi:hypothetical protein